MSKHHERTRWKNKSGTLRKRIAATLPRPCPFCPRPVLPTDKWDIDHIVPVSKGGTHALSNLRPAHASCNRGRKAKPNKNPGAPTFARAGW
jgi:5-methylcytosine-specific restriction endonuclease McrA